MVTHEPESCTEQETGDNQDPDGCVGIFGDNACAEGLVDCDPGSYGIGYVVGTVGDGHHHSGSNLSVGPEMFNSVVVALGLHVDVGKGLGRVGDAVA